MDSNYTAAPEQAGGGPIGFGFGLAFGPARTLHSRQWNLDPVREAMQKAQKTPKADIDLARTRFRELIRERKQR